MGRIAEGRVECDHLLAAIEEDGSKGVACGPALRELEERLAQPRAAGGWIDDEIVDVKVVTSCQRRHWPHAHHAAQPPVDIECSVEHVAQLLLSFDALLELLEVEVFA